MTPQESLAKGNEIHIATRNFKAAMEAMREDSGWSLLVKPAFQREIDKLEKDIREGGCENFVAYQADTAFLMLMKDLITLPERTKAAAQATLARQQVAQGVVPEEQSPEFLAAAALVRSEGSAERMPQEKEGLG